MTTTAAQARLHPDHGRAAGGGRPARQSLRAAALAHPGPSAADVPVAVTVDAAFGDEVVAWLEADLGCQVVAADGALAPRLTVTDDPSAGSGTVVVIDPATPDDARVRVAQQALRAGASDVVEWPTERTRIVALLSRESDRRTTGRPYDRHGVRVLRVAGATGGAGASTVALALAAWSSWAGARTMVVGGDDLLSLCGMAPWAGPGVDEIARLGTRDVAREIPALARAVDGAGDLRALGGGTLDASWVEGWPVDVVVADVGRAVVDADVVVAVPDRRLAGVAGRRRRTLVRAVDCVGRAEVRRLLGGPPRGWIEHDVRVARAGLQGRVPGALPGRWLKALATVAVARR